jgi:hypothetical protein
MSIENGWIDCVSRFLLSSIFANRGYILSGSQVISEKNFVKAPNFRGSSPNFMWYIRCHLSVIIIPELWPGFSTHLEIESLGKLSKSSFTVFIKRRKKLPPSSIFSSRCELDKRNQSTINWYPFTQEFSDYVVTWWVVKINLNWRKSTFIFRMLVCIEI